MYNMYIYMYIYYTYIYIYTYTSTPQQNNYERLNHNPSTTKNEIVNKIIKRFHKENIYIYVIDTHTLCRVGKKFFFGRKELKGDNL